MSRQNFWSAKRVLVTGGASFIGSHLCEELITSGVTVRIADNFSSGRHENLINIEKKIDILEGDLKDRCFTDKATHNQDVVFHLAADHGGRGYIATHPADCATNMALDNIVFETAMRNKAERICFASSACVYPTDIQSGDKKIRLSEDMVSFDKRGGAFADETYGWAKLMGEISLEAFYKQYGIKASMVRIFTAYGPRENETHAIIALIAKAFLKQDPFEIWGDGQQTRNFTYVKDIVKGLMLAAEHIDNAQPVNAGIPDFVRIQEVAETIFDIMGWKPKKVKYLTDRPVGVRHRAADTKLAKKLTGWMPTYTLKEGLRETIDWYLGTRDKKMVGKELDRLLIER